MSKKCLTLIGTASIQQYVFQSNRLKENVGASQLVSAAIDWWTTPEDSSWKVVFVGGGNAAVIFDQAPNQTALDVAQTTVTRWSGLTLQEAPGLRVVAAHQDFEQGGLVKAISAVREKLRQVENRPPSGASLGSLPFARQCNSTGAAAEEFWDNAWLSHEAATKRRAADEANRALEKKFARSEAKFKSFPVEIEHLGFAAGDKHIAIVHADGNGIGKLFGEEPTGTTEDDIIKHFKSLSERITKLATVAFQSILKRLSDRAEVLKAQPGFKLDGLFPLRPIVYGGDDLTFVCHGRLGLALAVAYLKAFETLSQCNGNGRLTACAGVAIIPAAFPFAKGYDLAESLCASAKHARTTIGDGSWLDFEIVREGTLPDLDDYRAANYLRGQSDSLLMRPYLISESSEREPSIRSWKSFQNNLASVSEPKLPRSKAKELRDAFRAAREADVIAFLKSRGHTFEDSWQEVDDDGKRRRCTLFDPLDAMDFYVPLEDM